MTVGAAWQARGHGHPADTVLLETAGPLVIPLVAYVLARATLATPGRGHSLAAAGEPLVAFGAKVRAVALAHVAVAALLSAIVCAAATALALLLVHASGLDVVHSAVLAALAGATYGTLFVAAASFGAAGGGLGVCVWIDALVGGPDTPLAILTPRGHLRNLFGGLSPLDCRPGSSLVVLAAMIVAATWLAQRRARAAD